MRKKRKLKREKNLEKNMVFSMEIFNRFKKQKKPEPDEKPFQIVSDGKSWNIVPNPDLKLKGRGVNLKFYVKPFVKKDDKQKLKDLIWKLGLFGQFFERTWIEFYDCKEETEVKIWCPETRFVIKLADAEDWYKKFFDHAFDDVKAILNKNGYKVKSYDFGFVYRIGVPETDLIPMPKLKQPMRKLD